MRNSLCLFVVLLISSICYSQEISNKFLHDLDINLELGKKYEMENIVTQFPYKNLSYGFERLLKLKKNSFFNEAELIFNNKNILTEIKLPFKTNKIAINEVDKVLSVLSDTINLNARSSFSLNLENESISANIERTYKYSKSYISFKLKYTDIEKKYNEFDKETTYRTSSDEYSELVLSFGNETSWINFNYVAILKKDDMTPYYYIVFQTENKSWKFFEEIQFLLDKDELVTLKLESKKQVTFDAKTSEVFITKLEENLINRLLQSKEISSRFIGKNIEKNTFKKNNLKPLQVLINHVNTQ